MKKTGNHYAVCKLGDLHKGGRDTLHDRLALTGAEISLNAMPAGVSVPFVHAHKMNEEVYIILEGKGQLFLDGEEFTVEKDDVIRIDPQGERCFRADDASGLKFICVQTKAGSLTQFTEKDGIPVKSKPSWLA